MESFHRDIYILNSFMFEQLSNELLNLYFGGNLVALGSYWDRNSEFDILAETIDGVVIVGECKYKNRKVSGNELHKLRRKIVDSNLKVDKFALFSKSGFSNSLTRLGGRDVILFELKDFQKINILNSYNNNYRIL